MNERIAFEFYEEHKMKPGKDFRLEVLKMSKEDVYDYLELKHGENVYGWMQKFWKSERSNEILRDKLEALQNELEELKKADGGLTSEFIKEIKADNVINKRKLFEAQILIGKLENWITKNVPTKFVNIKHPKTLFKEYKNETL